MKYLTAVATLSYNSDLCIGCRRCTEVCPHGVFVMEGKKAMVTDRDLCMECGACMVNCEPGAITVDAGVGCAAAMISGALRGTAPDCGCDGCC